MFGKWGRRIDVVGKTEKTITFTKTGRKLKAFKELTQGPGEGKRE